MVLKKNKIVLVLFFALLLRLVLVYPQFSGDIKNHLAWANGFLSNPVGFYGHHFPGFNDANYPPLAILLFSISNLFLLVINTIFNFLNSTIPVFPSFLVPLFSSQNMQMGFLKLPGIVSDIGTGWVIYSILQKRQAKYSLLTASLYLFNPAVIYISSVWGQIESITIFFLIYSLYLALFSKQKYLSLLMFAFGALTKQTVLWFSPLYLFLWYSEMDWQSIIKGLLMGVTIFFISYLPFGLLPVDALKNYFSTLSGSSNVVADAAWNLWYFFFPAKGTPDSVSMGILTVRQTSIILLILVLIILMIYLVKKYSRERFFLAIFIWSLAVFFLQTRVHERHLAFALPFLLLTPGIAKRYYLDYLALSIYHLSNLYFTLRLPFV